MRVRLDVAEPLLSHEVETERRLDGMIETAQRGIESVLQRGYRQWYLVNYRRIYPTVSCRHDVGIKPTSLRARSKPNLRIKFAELISRCVSDPQLGQQC